jgi:hypothetical protein
MVLSKRVYPGTRNRFHFAKRQPAGSFHLRKRPASFPERNKIGAIRKAPMKIRGKEIKCYSIANGDQTNFSRHGIRDLYLAVKISFEVNISGLLPV